MRRWLVSALVVVCLGVGGTYLYLRHRVQNALKQVPGKIGVEIQESAQEFTISKSVQGRTLFKLQASKAVQFKLGGRAELHNVTITLYGRDSSRFDQVSGEEFEYDQQSGNVTGKGEVSIDLQANPQGILHPDQAMPRALKNPIHLKTSDLVFNKNTGDAWTPSRIEFRVPHASGSAVGAKYVAQEGVLTLESRIEIGLDGPTPATLHADRARLEKNPRQIILSHPHAESGEQRGEAEELTLYLDDDNTLEHATATGNVRVAASSASLLGGRRPAPATAPWSQVTAQRLEVSMGRRATVREAVFSGDVRYRSQGAQTLTGTAGRAVLDFSGRNSLSRVHSDGGVELVEASEPADERGRRFSTNRKPLQTIAIDAPAMDFLVGDQKLTRVETAGPPQIVLSQTAAGASAGAETTRVTADRFVASFDSLGQLSQVHGAANVRVVSSAAPANHIPQPDRVSTSDSIDAFFRPGTAMDSIVQQGHFAYRCGTQQAFAQSALYTLADQILTLSGMPRIVDAGIETTASRMRLNRATGDGVAEGDVRTSYSDLKSQPAGALLAASDPVHVTAESMSARTNPVVATYTGNARLWQGANVIAAPSIEFYKDQRSVLAHAKGDQKVSTVLIGTDKNGNAMAVRVTSSRLVYRDSERKAHFDGGVTVRGSDLTITSNQMDVFLAPASTGLGEGRARPSKTSGETPAASPTPNLSKLDKIVASGSVVITEPNRRATGEQLTYTASDERFVLTGGPPSIFDAEHGKITAVSLTLFRRDARVEVEGDSTSPAVTETRVVR
jgi:lipopolysaccharide export system protein LptA